MPLSLSMLPVVATRVATSVSIPPIFSHTIQTLSTRGPTQRGGHMLKRLPVPQTCEDCGNTAYWSWELQPICYSHLRGMAEMNSDNESAVYDALISPVLLPAASDVVHAMIIHKSTSPMAICQ